MAQRQFRSDDTSFWQEKYGLGTDGSYTPSTSTDSTPNTTFSASSGSTSATFGSGTGFANGNLLFIHQSRNGGSGVGLWEFNKIASGGGTTSVTLSYATTNAYNTTAQVYLIKQYSTVNIAAGVTLTSIAWNGSTGGILVLFAQQSITIDGALVSNAKGYVGGAARSGIRLHGLTGEGTSGAGQAETTAANGNAGGGGQGESSGGSSHGAGGAGGGHASSGTNGGNSPATWVGGTGGGTAGSADLITMVFGGSGASGGTDDTANGPSGSGGRGAGLIILASPIITGIGSIALNGEAGVNSGNGASGGDWAGGGGAGAGGSLLFKGKTITLDSMSITASGASGGQGQASADGGASSVGRIHADYATTFSGTTSPTIDLRQDITLGETEQDLSVKANIKVTNTNGHSVIANILRAGDKQANSSKAALILNRGSQYNSTLANIFSGEFKKKKYSYKVYYSETDVRDVWGNEVVSVPSFRTSINSGPGELVVKLARRFDAFGEGDDIVLDRKVDVYVYDRDEPQGALLYQGFISSYSPILEGTNEYIEITILGYAVEVGQRILKDGAGNTTIDYTSEDPSDIMRDVIDKYIADGGSLTYDATTIDDTSTTVSYRFANYTVKDALDKIIELTPFDWYWRIDPDGKIYLKEQSATADHKIYIGKHVSYMKPERSIEDVRNVVYFVGGTPEGDPQLYRKYTRSASVATYGLREEVLTDSRVTLASTADTKAGRFLDAHESPDTRTTIRILDNNGQNSGIGYDIESIRPGDTISIENLKTSQKQQTLWDQAQWDDSNWDFEINSISSDILNVINVTYNPFILEIEAARALPVVAKRIEDIDRNVNDLSTTDLPVAPTVV